ncbi:MAG: SLAC1 anion channel family protein, partial [Hansschlegelia sp.]
MAAVETTETAKPRSVRKPILEYLPVGLFGSVMGLAGLSGAWRLAAGRYGAPAWIADSIGWIAVATFIVLALAYAAKAITAPAAVRTEFEHPIAGALFGTVFISLLLTPPVLAPYSRTLAIAVWGAGAAGIIGFGWIIVHRWMGSRQLAAHATPTWFVPVVGLLDVPLAAPALGLDNVHGLLLFGFAVGLFFAIPLFTLIFSRVLFEEPLPHPLRPTMMILVAPFSVGFSSYVAVFDRIDGFAESLFLISLFLLAVLIARLRDLPVCCPFRVSWWAVSFPLAATAAAATRYAAHEQSLIADAIAIALLTVASIVVLGLGARTVAGIVR